MDHWEFKESVRKYKERSGHAINYYDGGAEKNNRESIPAAKDKMRDLHAKADGSVNGGKKRRIVTTLINDTP
jgi:hypothetical protein